MHSQLENCLKYIVFKLYDVYYDIEDVYTYFFCTKDRVIYNYVDKNYYNDKRKYIVVDNIKEIAFFENYDSTYKKKDNIASAICILENDEQIDVTNFLNLFTLEGAKLNFSDEMLPYWKNIISEFHKSLSYPIKRFEFIDIEGNMIFNETNYLLSVDDFSIERNLHKE